MTRFNHMNFNVFDLQKSIDFYKEALGMSELRRKEAEDGSFILCFMGYPEDPSFRLELTWLKDRKEPYNLGDLEYHLAFTVSDMAASRKKHEEMGAVCFDNPKMGLYFIHDPDGYWLEIMPERK